MLIQLSGENVNLPENAVIADPPKNIEKKSFYDVVKQALDCPLDLEPLEKYCLENKKVAVLVDDWGRPTPGGEFLPLVLDRLNRAGAEDKNITIITASGMHDPMDEQKMMDKVGKEAFLRVRCVSHDGGDHNSLTFCGITDLGTPVWVNSYVAEADFKIILGRIYPHSNYGYEGGYKMIVPGVASFETILRDHSLNFSDYSDYGILKNNPSRDEADAVGRLVGVDFSVNFVMDWEADPVAAYGGTPEAVFKAGVDYGQRNVWGATTGGELADVTVICHKEMGDLSLDNNPNYYIGLAKSVTKPDGIVISTMEYKPQSRNLMYGYDLDEMPLDQLIQLHEKRDWNLNPREIQHAIKRIRGTFYRRREFEYRKQKLYLISEDYPAGLLEKWDAEQFKTIQDAVDQALKKKRNPHIFVIGDAKHTLPLVDYDYKDSISNGGR